MSSRINKMKRISQNTSQDVKLFTEKSMDILDRIHELLNSEFGGKQKLLAEKLGKTEPEISKWLSGVQNFTLVTICKLEAAFGKDILAVHTNDDEEANIKQVKPSCLSGKVSMQIQPSGKIKEKVYFKEVHQIFDESQLFTTSYS